MEGQSINALKACNMVLRKPVKYNPDKRDFVLTEGALASLDKSSKPKVQSFDTQSEVSSADS